MGRYSVVFRKSVARDLRRIPNRNLSRILEAVESLSEEPRRPGVERLPGIEEKYRLRKGDYRIVFETRDDEAAVVVVKVGRRKQVYRRT